MSLPARRSRADRSTETRALLIHAAVELLQSSGFASATTARVAAHAGLTTGALHHHFPTKGDLMFGVLEHVSIQLRSRLEEQDCAAGPPGINATQLVAHLWEVYGDPAYWATWEIIIGTRSDESFHQRVVADRAGTMRTIIHPWVERQVLSSDFKPEAVALLEFMLVAIRGLSLERFLDKDAAYFENNLRLLAETVGHRFEQLTTTSGRTGTGSTRARRTKS
jgi:AcrR family transcriptional regulator